MQSDDGIPTTCFFDVINEKLTSDRPPDISPLTLDKLAEVVEEFAAKLDLTPS